MLAPLKSLLLQSARSFASGHVSNVSLNALRTLSAAAAPPWVPGASGYLGTGPRLYDESEHEPKFLVTGACGQIGSELIPYLRKRVGIENVIASDVKTSRQLLESGPFVYLDVTDKDNLARITIEYGVTHIIHLATLLSAVGERNPQLALKINTAGIQNVLDLAASHGLGVYSPSTIAVFGDTSPKVNTPNDTVMQPTTMYGITKVHAELLGQYYADKFNVDFRSLRYPGIISAKAPPGGGTTDYAVDIFHQALKQGSYTCFLSEDAELPMMYMPDCLEATWQLIMAPKSKLTRTTYNVTAMSFSPRQLFSAIKHHIPHFSVQYTPDYREAIAQTWPKSIDDSLARRDWGWRHQYDLSAMTRDMLDQLRQQMVVEEQRRQAKAAGVAAKAAAGNGHKYPNGSAWGKGNGSDATAAQLVVPGHLASA